MSHTRPARPRRSKHAEYDFNVFINCPFDEEYDPLFRAIIFSIHACGFIARCSREISNQNIRFSRIIEIIGECKYGIHDLSRISLEENVLPRNNMPLELGVFIGCRHFGSPYDYEKEYLILDSIPHRYKHHITDLGGEDPSIHHDKVEEMVRCIRDWLVQRAQPSERKLIQSPSILASRLADFNEEGQLECAKRGWRFDELLFYEYVELVTDWLFNERKKMIEYVKFEETVIHGVSVGKVKTSFDTIPNSL